MISVLPLSVVIVLWYLALLFSFSFLVLFSLHAVCHCLLFVPHLAYHVPTSLFEHFAQCLPNECMSVSCNTVT